LLDVSGSGHAEASTSIDRAVLRVVAGLIVAPVASAAHSVTASFSNRPGGAPDVVLSLIGLLESANAVPSQTSFPDTFSLLTNATTFEGTDVSVGRFTASFRDQGFFAGTGVPPVPLFAPDDLASQVVGLVREFGRSPVCFATNVTLTAVPEPASLGLALVGLAVLARWRRVRERASGHLDGTRNSSSSNSAKGAALETGLGLL